MNITFLGSSSPSYIVKELLRMGSYVNFAGNTLQQALLSGFSELIPNFKVISGWNVSPFPKVRKLHFNRRQVDEVGIDSYVYVGGSNIWLMDRVTRFFRCRRELKRTIPINGESAVIVYETHSPFLLAATTLRKRIKHICLIIPDLPQYMSGNTNKVYLFLKKIDAIIINHCLRKIDSFALLSEGMAEVLPIEGKKWIVMEGIYQDSVSSEKPIEKDPHKVIMYAGGIHGRRGTELLLEAFELIKDEDYRLWIRGDGDDEMKAKILSLSKQDSRVTYFEPMHRGELLRMEQTATVMVNPTQPSLEFTKYFFPSKTMEYLASGTPTVMFHLACMPKEYDDFLFYVEEESAEALKNKLVEVCELPEEIRSQFGERARSFILKNKTPQIQCRRIINLIDN